MASALAYGADGVWIGTRFLLTPEAHTVPFYKERLLAASSEDTVVTKSYTGRRLRVLKNKYTEVSLKKKNESDLVNFCLISIMKNIQN